MSSSPAWRAADAATDDLFRVRVYAAVLADAMEGPSDDPVRQGLMRLAFDLVAIGNRLREHHEKIMEAAGTPATVAPFPTRKRV